MEYSEKWYETSKRLKRMRNIRDKKSLAENISE